MCAPTTAAGPAVPEIHRAYARAGAARHRRRAALRVGRPRVHPRPARRRARRATVGRAVARHAPQRPGPARRRPPAARRHRRAPVPAQGARRRASRCRCRPIRPAEQAEAGFAAGRYPDAEPKPELLCALTPFTAYCGVRPVDATLPLLDELGAVRAGGRPSPPSGPGGALEALYRGRVHVEPDRAGRRGSDRPEARWVQRARPRATPATRASPPRSCSTSSSWRPARPSSSDPATSTPTSAAPASS